MYSTFLFLLSLLVIALWRRVIKLEKWLTTAEKMLTKYDVKILKLKGATEHLYLKVRAIER